MLSVVLFKRLKMMLNAYLPRQCVWFHAKTSPDLPQEDVGCELGALACTGQPPREGCTRQGRPAGICGQGSLHHGRALRRSSPT